MGFFKDLIDGLKSKHTQKVESLNEHILDISNKIAQSCGTVVSQSQSNVIKNTGWSLFSSTSVKQTTDVTQKCFSSVDIQQELQTSIMNKIDSDMKVDGINLTQVMGPDTDMHTTISNKIKKSLTLENVQNSYINIRQKQDTIILNEGVSIGSSIDISQGATVYALSVMETLASVGVYDDIRTSVRQSSNIISNLLAPLWDNLGMIIMVVIIIAALAFGLPFVMGLIRGGSSAARGGGGGIDWSGGEYGYDEYDDVFA